MTDTDGRQTSDIAPDLNAFLTSAAFALPDMVGPGTWVHHAPFAFWLVDALRPRRIAEIGTRDGASYRVLCQAARSLGPDVRLTASPCVEDFHPALLADHDARYGDLSRVLGRAPAGAADQVDDGSVDLLHVASGGASVFAPWRAKLSDRAVVTVHGFEAGPSGIGPRALWEELRARHPAFAFAHGGGLGFVAFGPHPPSAVQRFLAAAAAHPSAVRSAYRRLGSAATQPAASRPAVPPAAELPPPSVAAGVPSLHVHVAAMAPQFLEVRTHIPLAALARLPGVATSLSEKRIELPRLPKDQPKVLVLQRPAMNDLDRWRRIVDEVVGRGWILVTELDDHPDLLGAVHKVPVDDRSWRSVCLAHAAQTSTPAMAEAIRAWNPEVKAFPNAARAVVGEARRPASDGRVRVFYGALNRESFSRQVGAALAPFAAERRNVEFVVVHDRAFFEALGPCTKAFHPAQPYDGYLRLMSDCDVALMPLEGGPGERFKSDVKWVEASSFGLASVASPVVYADSVRDGVTGLLAPMLADWPAQLRRLVEDPALRAEVAGAARTEVAHGRSLAAAALARRDWYAGLWARRFHLAALLKSRTMTVV
ncbi:hypothetical protein D3273_20960 [Lichenibacterium minor]|uniref:Glycosyltransferase n=1 Tax=Lichenibacterium minor TaxID=2316528 RepID=A0A4Q2U508_9HYPH|nr:hypothetical protein [Lichenibacterium minor]RYC30007.1 hypothetical protein D3273_20960 [Lichenibacterium minor]